MLITLLKLLLTLYHCVPLTHEFHFSKLSNLFTTPHNSLCYTKLQSCNIVTSPTKLNNIYTSPYRLHWTLFIIEHTDLQKTL